MDAHTLHPTMHPTRPREGHPRMPRRPRAGGPKRQRAGGTRPREGHPRPPRAGGPKRNHPSWRGRYVHAPRYGTRAAPVVVKTTFHARGKRRLRSMTAATTYEIAYMRKEHDLQHDVDRAVYTRDNDRLLPEERTAFTTRTREDGWQWRMVISPEHGKDLDMTQLTRDLMRDIEKDTGYTLDWVAANHYNTEHPHSHVIVRGQDLDGLEVGLKRDYICRGIPYRARDLATEQMDRQRALDRDLEHEHVLHDPRYWKDLDAYERTLQPQQKQDYEQELGRG